MRIVAFCGSLRSHSCSAVLLRTARQLAPAGVDFELFDGLGHLPLFNPDLLPCAPESVIALWDVVAGADAIVIASPEYAHGVTGTIKNGLDWLVGHAPFAHKPVAVFNPAYQAHHADDALREILRTMSADLIPGACLRIPLVGSSIRPGDIATTEALSALTAAWQAIVAHVQARRRV